MKDTIICYSEIDNSYYVAKKIAKSQEHDNIFALKDINDSLEVPERLGFVLPLVVGEEEQKIKDKIREIFKKFKNLENLKYVYIITTSEIKNYSWFHIRFEAILTEFGVATTYSNNIKMKTNYYEMKNKNNEIENKINLIFNEVKEEKYKLPKMRVFTRLSTNISYIIAKNKITKTQRK